jgi:hypothetical protein
MSGQEERELVLRLNINGWVIFLAMTVASVVYLPSEITMGVFLGGLLVAVNLSLLHRAVARALQPGNRVTPQSILPKFYLCFFATVTIIFVLISQNLVDELGLLLGLSVFILNVFFIVIPLAGKIVYRTITKEAV